MRRPPRAVCRAVVAVPTVRPWQIERFKGWVDYVVVDTDKDADLVRGLGFGVLVNKYGGKSGALATVLEEVEADVYVFVDDDAVPGPWIGDLKSAGCLGFATAYRWVLDRFQNAFSLGGFDWMVWRRTRFLYGGAMAVPAYAKRGAVEALKRCPVDDMALTAVAEEIRVLPALVPMRGAEDAWEFFLRQATAAKLGNAALWALELAFYLLWTAAALLFPPLFLIQAARTALRSRRALGRVDWLQVLMSPAERPLQAFVFAWSLFRRCFKWHGREVCEACVLKS